MVFFLLGKCECDLDGSANGNLCDIQTGVCTCKGGFSGDNCEGKILYLNKTRSKL